MTTHQSDSAVQRDAERAIVDALAAELGVVLVPAGTLSLSGGVRIQLDARSEDGKFAIEAYARQGTLKGGQLKKIAQDVLKLALLRQEPDHVDVRPIIVFASERPDRRSPVGSNAPLTYLAWSCTLSTSPLTSRDDRRDPRPGEDGQRRPAGRC